MLLNLEIDVRSFLYQSREEDMRAAPFLKGSSDEAAPTNMDISSKLVARVRGDQENLVHRVHHDRFHIAHVC